MAEYVTKRPNSHVWWYSRKWPVATGKRGRFVRSLRTTDKREAEREARKISVEFDRLVQMAIEASQTQSTASEGGRALQRNGSTTDAAQAILERLPMIPKDVATAIVREQVQNPTGWHDYVNGIKLIAEAAAAGQPNPTGWIPAEAAAILQGVAAAERGEVPEGRQSAKGAIASDPAPMQGKQWSEVKDEALKLYRQEVTEARWRMVRTCLEGVGLEGRVQQRDIEAGLLAWTERRMQEVKPRTASHQLDGAISCLRLVLSDLKVQKPKALRGVMQPNQNDRKPAEISTIRAAITAAENRPKSTKVRDGYNGGASQWDALYLRALAVLGCRPRELLGATSDALIQKTDVFGQSGWYLRIQDAKNKASERDIPLSDGVQEVLPLEELRLCLHWQAENKLSAAGAVSSLGTRLKKWYSPYMTLYQMRHTWKDIVLDAGVEFEVRERLMGHKVSGVAAVYGGGIPLQQGLYALMAVKKQFE